MNPLANTIKLIGLKIFGGLGLTGFSVLECFANP
jgi:hypothetical protein